MGLEGFGDDVRKRGGAVNVCPCCGQTIKARGRFYGRLSSALLNRLRQAEGGIVSYRELVTYLWQDDPTGGPLNSLTMIHNYVMRLRRIGYPIQTVWGHGLRFGPTYLASICEIDI